MNEKDNKPKRKKYGGRVAGTPNKVTGKTRELIANLMTDYAQSGKMLSDFNELEPKERIAIAEKLMQYSIPKMQATTLEVENAADAGLTLEVRLAQLAEDNDE